MRWRGKLELEDLTNQVIACGIKVQRAFVPLKTAWGHLSNYWSLKDGGIKRVVRTQ